MRNQVARLSFAAFIALACPASLLATVILPNLPPGSQYEILFITLDSHTPASTDIGTYNDFVAAEANLSPVLHNLTLQQGIQWHAVASTSTINAIVNAPDGIVDIYNTQGIKLATAANGIYNNGLLSPVQFNQFGSTEVTQAYTGSTIIGGPEDVLGTDQATFGDSGETGTRWIDEGWVNFPAGFGKPFYALSSPITVVPEPSSLVLFGVGAFGLFAFTRRRRQPKK